MMVFSSEELRRLARAGALEQAKRIVCEFPDVLTELNQLATARRRNGQAPRFFAAAADEARAILRSKPKRTMSAAARKRISRAQKQRWAKHKKAAGE